MCKKHGRAARAHNGHPTPALASMAHDLARDPRLYRLAAMAIRCTHTKDAAARYLFATLAQDGIAATRDGHPFTRAGIRYALRYI